MSHLDDENERAGESLPDEIPVGDDPLWSIVGLGSSGVGDLAVEHDRYLAQMEEDDNRHGDAVPTIFRHHGQPPATPL